MEEDDEAVVETVEDRYEEVGEPRIHPPPQQVSYTTVLTYTFLHYFSNPWALLILAFLTFKLWSKLKATLLAPLYDRYYDWQDRRAEQQEAERYKKNPDEYRIRLEAMERARNRMQELHDQKADEWARKQLEIEEKKRQQDIEDWENHQQGKGYKNKAHTGEDREREALVQQARIKNKKGFRPEGNPLMGLGGSSGYRPSRLGLSGGGG